jgi:catechol 2,3-dioxygenase-like lactoylglutathione lyase family enzyme
LAFFDFPGLNLEQYHEVLGGLHHAISVEHARWQQFKDKLAAADVEVAEHTGASLYFRDPDGARIELIADPLGDMYGSKVL